MSANKAAAQPPGIHKTLPHPLLPLPPPWVSDGVLTLHTPSVVGTQDGVGAPWHRPGDAGCVQGERDMGLLHSWKEGRGVGELEGRKCLFQCCHSKQSAPGNFASSVFALSSCFPTIHTDFGGAQHQGWCLAFPAGAGGRKGGCIPLPSFQWP